MSHYYAMAFLESLTNYQNKTNKRCAPPRPLRLCVKIGSFETGKLFPAPKNLVA